MAKAGWCAQCGANVWLAEDGSCVNGHEASEISNVYEAEQERDAFAQAADSVEQAAREAGTAVKEAWDHASPQAKEAADAAADAAKKAATAAMGFGKKLFGKDEEVPAAGEQAGSEEPEQTEAAEEPTDPPA
jgi:hypothetical protein